MQDQQGGDNEEQQPVESDLVKPKKPRTPAQVEAFTRAREKRHERLRSLNKPAPVVEEKTSDKHTRAKSVKKPAQQIIYEESESEEEEPQQIIIRRKHKSKVKPKIVYEDSESSSEEECAPQRKPQPSQKQKKLPAPSRPTQPVQQQSYGLLFM